MLAVAALVVGGNARAGLVGIAPTTNPTSNLAASNLTNILTFNTTGLGGLKISALSLYGNDNHSYSSARILITGGNYNLEGIFDIGFITTSSNQLAITWDGFSYDGVLEAETNYTVSLEIGSRASEFYSIGPASGTANPYSVNSSVSNYLSGPVAGTNSDVAINLYYDPASVPEPGTLILTGSALVAGAVGAYLKRRRKTQQQEAA